MPAQAIGTRNGAIIRNDTATSAMTKLASHSCLNAGRVVNSCISYVVLPPPFIFFVA